MEAEAEAVPCLRRVWWWWWWWRCRACVRWWWRRRSRASVRRWSSAFARALKLARILSALVQRIQVSAEAKPARSQASHFVGTGSLDTLHANTKTCEIMLRAAVHAAELAHVVAGFGFRSCAASRECEPACADRQCGEHARRGSSSSLVSYQRPRHVICNAHTQESSWLSWSFFIFRVIFQSH